jgi:hypothetical protein
LPAVDTVVSPVTQTEVVAVNKASINEVCIPGAEATGKYKRIAPTKITPAKPRAIICAVFNFVPRFFKEFICNIAFLLFYIFIIIMGKCMANLIRILRDRFGHSQCFVNIKVNILAVLISDDTL